VPGRQIVKFSENFGWRYRKETLKARNLCKCDSCPCK
jgi:hypothetical protein